MSKKREAEIKILLLEARVYRAAIVQDIHEMQQKTQATAPLTSALGLTMFAVKALRSNTGQPRSLRSLFSFGALSTGMWLLRRYLEKKNGTQT